MSPYALSLFLGMQKDASQEKIKIYPHSLQMIRKNIICVDLKLYRMVGILMI